MSKSGLFAHFKSKEQLQLQTLEHGRQRFIDVTVRPALAVSRGEKRVRELFEGWLRWENEVVPGGCLFVTGSIEFDDQPGPMRDALVRDQRDWLDAVATVAEAAVSEGDFRADLDPRAVRLRAPEPDPRLPPLRPPARGRARGGPGPHGLRVPSSTALGRADPTLTERKHRHDRSQRSRKARSFVSGTSTLRAAFRAADLVAPRRRRPDRPRPLVHGCRRRWRRRRCHPAASRSPSPRRARRSAATSSATAPSVYLVHGWGGRGSQLAAFVEPLVAAGHRVVLFDAPSHGDSDPGPGRAGSHPRRGVRQGARRRLRPVRPRRGRGRALARHRRDVPVPCGSAGSAPSGWCCSPRWSRRGACSTSSRRSSASAPAPGAPSTATVDEFVGLPIAEFDAIVQAAHVDAGPDAGRARPRRPADAVRRRASGWSAALPDAELVTTEGLGHRRILRDPRSAWCVHPRAGSWRVAVSQSGGARSTTASPRRARRTA